MKKFFIAGTDTNIGKTYVTCQLLSYLNSEQPQALAIKPVVSGAIEQDGKLIYQDVALLQQHNAAQDLSISNWYFKEQISPHIAAARNQMQISASEIVEYCNQPQFNHREYLFIEGAGGLMAPLNQSETWLDVLSLSRIPVILVVGMRLGCLNHSLLTAHALQSNRISCVGWVANCVDPNMLEFQANLETLIHSLPWPLIASVPFQGRITQFISKIG